jgi:hypothetical protein
VRVYPRPLRARDEHVKEWRDAQLRQLASGTLTTALGIHPCFCKRRWPCDLCGEPFVCWDVWPFLWKTLPRELHGKKLCRRCYGRKLLEALGADGAAAVGEPAPAPPPPTPRRAPATLPAAFAPLPLASGPRMRHYRRR